MRWWAIAERLVNAGKSVKLEFRGVFGLDVPATSKSTAEFLLSFNFHRTRTGRLNQLKSLFGTTKWSLNAEYSRKMFYELINRCAQRNSSRQLSRTGSFKPHQLLHPCEHLKLRPWGAIVSLNVLSVTLVKNVEINRNHRTLFRVI